MSLFKKHLVYNWQLGQWINADHLLSTISTMKAQGCSPQFIKAHAARIAAKYNEDYNQ